jgi:ribonuclease HI
MIVKTIQKNPPVSLLLKGEIISEIKATNIELKGYLEDGMPHYLIGNEYRFLADEVKAWLKSYKPSQERLEKLFCDKKGRTIEEYVTEDVILTTLRIKKDKLVGLCRNGMPHEKVGEKDFFHIQDILDHTRQGALGIPKENKGQGTQNGTKGSATKLSSKNAPEQSTKKPSKKTTKQAAIKSSENAQKIPKTQNTIKQLLLPLSQKFPKEVPFIIVDGSYDYKNHLAGSGLVLIEDWNKATALSNVRKIETTKSIVAEFLALLDALILIKQKNMNNAIILTDQEPWSKALFINWKKYNESFKPYITEINQLRAELKGKVKIKYIGDLHAPKNNPLHKKADSLSKEYRISSAEILAF